VVRTGDLDQRSEERRVETEECRCHHEADLQRSDEQRREMMEALLSRVALNHPLVIHRL
jgi:hypothetical protein